MSCIVWMVSNWANKAKDFLDVSIFYSNLSWKAFFEGGRKVKPMKTPSWISPPAGLLKLNFDGSFLKELRKGGFGGVTRDSLDIPLCTYSGSLDCVHSNEAEVFAMLVGCRGLWKLGGHNAIIEGDSFSAIPWGLG